MGQMYNRVSPGAVCPSLLKEVCPFKTDIPRRMEAPQGERRWSDAVVHAAPRTNQRQLSSKRGEPPGSSEALQFLFCYGRSPGALGWHGEQLFPDLHRAFQPQPWCYFVQDTCQPTLRYLRGLLCERGSMLHTVAASSEAGSLQAPQVR